MVIYGLSWAFMGRQLKLLRTASLAHNFLSHIREAPQLLDKKDYIRVLDFLPPERYPLVPNLTPAICPLIPIFIPNFIK